MEEPRVWGRVECDRCGKETRCVEIDFHFDHGPIDICAECLKAALDALGEAIE